MHFSFTECSREFVSHIEYLTTTLTYLLARQITLRNKFEKMGQELKELCELLFPGSSTGNLLFFMNAFSNWFL